MSTPTPPKFYKLHPAEFGDYFKHLLRLDRATRDERFKGQVDDSALQAHALRLAVSDTMVFGVRMDGDIRATVELAPSAMGHTATAALTVEPLYRGHGLGRSLLSDTLNACRPLGILSLLFDASEGNGALIHLLSSFGGQPTRQKGLYALNLERRAVDGNRYADRRGDERAETSDRRAFPNQNPQRVTAQWGGMGA